MESTAPFELSQLQRAWIESDSGGSFDALFQSALQRINSNDAAETRGVLIVETDPLAFAAAFFAAVYLQVPLALANPNWQTREWGEVEALLSPALIFGRAPLATDARELAVSAPTPGSILIPSGGSTGGVKFAVHRWGSLQAACDGFQAFLGAGAVNSFCVLPLYHVSGLMQLLRSFCLGGRIAFGSMPQAVGGLCLSLVPTQLQRWMEDPQALKVLQEARAIFVGGAPMSTALADPVRQLQLPIVLSYGMTETAAMVAAIPAVEFLSQPDLPSAASLPHVRIDILDGSGELCAPGEVGRIRIQSRSLFEGYHGQPALDLAQGYLTDDLGRLDVAGGLTVLGRCDTLIISGGEKIDPRDVERAILATGLAREALALGQPDPEWGQKLVAFYVPVAEPIATKEWAQHLRPHLVNYKLPKIWIPVAALPLDEKGKVQPQRIAQLIATHLESI